MSVLIVKQPQITRAFLIFNMITFFVLTTFLTKNLLRTLREIHSLSLLGVKVLNAKQITWTLSPSYLISAYIPLGHFFNACEKLLQASACEIQKLK